MDSLKATMKSGVQCNLLIYVFIECPDKPEHKCPSYYTLCSCVCLFYYAKAGQISGHKTNLQIKKIVACPQLIMVSRARAKGSQNGHGHTCLLIIFVADL